MTRASDDYLDWQTRNVWFDTDLTCDQCGRNPQTVVFEHAGTDDGLCGRCYGRARGYIR